MRCASVTLWQTIEGVAHRRGSRNVRRATVVGGVKDHLARSRHGNVGVGCSRHREGHAR